MAKDWFARLSSPFFVLFLTTMLFGCVVPSPPELVKGPAFEPVVGVPDDKALVYMFWPYESYRTEFDITANGKRVGVLRSSGYFPFVADAGEINLAAKVNFKLLVTGALTVAVAPSTYLTISVDPGGVYYVKGAALEPTPAFIGVSKGQRLGMTLETEEIGKQSIEQCCRLLPSKT